MRKIIPLLFALLIPCCYAQTNMGPINTPQVNSTLYVGSLSGSQFYPTIQSAVTSACASGAKRVVDIPPAYTGIDPISGVTGGCTNTTLRDEHAGLPVACYTWQTSVYSSSGVSCANSTGGTLTAVTGTAPVVATPSGSTVNVSMQDSTVTPGTYLNVAFTVSAKGLITAAGPPFSASFGCTQCGTYEIGYSGITAASGAISYANPSVPTSASVSDGTNTDTLSTPFTSWVLSHTYTTNTTFTLTTLGNGQTVTQSNGIAFVPRSYGGTGSGGATGATASGTSAALVGASGTLTNIGLGTSCAGQSFTATTSGTQYIYYLSPCNVSNPGGGSFTIPGPTVFPMNAPTSFTFTGQYGGTWTGYLYQSVNAYVSGTNYTIGVGN
jgi:hypothetical protein